MPQPSENLLNVDYAVLSDIGMRRANNQDSFFVQTAQTSDRWTRYGHLFIVADGMGAHAAGELASKLATEKIAQHYLKPSEQTVSEALRNAVSKANVEIYRRGQENPEFHNMGTTASALVLGPWGAVAAHVGDSRIYRLRGNVLDQLTFDHSLVWEMEASGQVQRGSAISDAIPKNVITRSLGPGAEVVVDVEGPTAVQAGDTYLLCSDGLTGQVADTEIGVLLALLPPQEAARVLVDLANLRGGPDNVTVVVARVAGAEGASKPTLSLPQASRSKLVTPLFVFASLFVFAGIGLAAIGNFTLMAVLFALGLVAAGAAVASLSTGPPAGHAVDLHHNHDASEQQGPYRQYICAADEGLVSRLGGTVAALRKAAQEKKWNVSWEKVDPLQSEADRERRQGDYQAAVRLQAQAIIATMQQLRQQHQQVADSTTLDF